MVKYFETRNEYLEKNINETKSVFNAVGRLRVNVLVTNNKGFSSSEIGENTGNMRNFDKLLFGAKENAVAKHLKAYNDFKGGSNFFYVSGGNRFGDVSIKKVEVLDYSIFYFDKSFKRKRVNIKGKYYTEVRQNGRYVLREPYRFKRVDSLNK